MPTEILAHGAVLEIRPSGVVWFANAQAVSDAVVAAIAEHEEVRLVRLRLEGFGRIDLTAALTFARLVEDLRTLGVEAELSGIPAVARPVLERVLASETDEQRLTRNRSTERAGGLKT